MSGRRFGRPRRRPRGSATLAGLVPTDRGVALEDRSIGARAYSFSLYACFPTSKTRISVVLFLYRIFAQAFFRLRQQGTLRLLWVVFSPRWAKKRPTNGRTLPGAESPTIYILGILSRY